MLSREPTGTRFYNVIKYASCYDTAMYEVERPVIFWVHALMHWERICSTWKACLRRKTRVFPETHELGLSLPVHERNKAAILLSLSK